MRICVVNRTNWRIAALAVVVAAISATMGCTSDPASPATLPPPVPISIGGAYTVVGSSAIVQTPQLRLDYTATITNQGTEAQEVRYSGCWVFVQLHRADTRTGPPDFDSSELPLACELLERTIVVQGGASAQIVSSTYVATLRLHGVSPGRYFVSIRLAPGGREVTLPAGEVVIPES